MNTSPAEQQLHASANVFEKFSAATNAVKALFEANKQQQQSFEAATAEATASIRREKQREAAAFV